MSQKMLSTKAKEEVIHMNLTFKLKRHIQEEHKPTMVYSVRFCDINTSFYSYFATVGGNCASIYHNDEDGNTTLVQGYLDEDTEEILYACAWSSTPTAPILLVVAGLRGILKCINCLTYEIDSVLLGHGNAVNDLRVHPINNSLIFSASKDESVRLWNIETGICIAVFSGEKGHRDEILSVDPHPLGNCFCTGGMDTSIKIWGLEEDRIKDAIDRSFTSPRRPGNLPFEPVPVQVPLFSTNQVHSDYIDSVRWFGNCIISKSTKNRIALWAPDTDRYKGAPLVLREFIIEESNLWFVRMDVCVPLDVLAVGTKDGRVFVYSLSSLIEEVEPIKKLGRPRLSTLDSRKKLADTDESTSTTRPDTKLAAVSETYETTYPIKASSILSHPKCYSTVRQVAFHPQGKQVIYSCDDGSISVWAIQSNVREVA